MSKIKFLEKMKRWFLAESALARRKIIDEERAENIKRGKKALKEAKKLPGFVNAEGKVSKEGEAAIKLVLSGKFVGPNALNNAYFYYLIREEEREKRMEKRRGRTRTHITANRQGGQ